MTLEYTQSQTLQFFPPTEGPLRRHTHTYDLMRQCIHCGFCLPTCPTYAVLGVEMDSPRGRIFQMQAVADGKLDISDDFVEHMNCCVGCRACETACPSGVQFGKLIEAAREQIQLTPSATVIPHATIPNEQEETTEITAQTRRRASNSVAMTLLRRFFFSIMLPSRRVLSIVFGGLKVYQRSGLQAIVRNTGLLNIINSFPTPFKDKLKLPEELMSPARGSIVPAMLPEITPARGLKRYRVGMISGCIMDQVFHDINEATIRVLAANGCEVITPRQQGCCGALHVHGGEAEQGRELARKNIDIFEPYNCDIIIINSAGCGSTLKEYSHLLREDDDYKQRAQAFSAKVKDISEFLVTIQSPLPMGEINRTIAYHDACHLLHGQKIKQQPRQLLASIPGINIVSLTESDWCCGSAGIYNLTNQEMAQQLLERKMNHIEATKASIIATGNPGCMMQIAMGARQRGLELEVMHPIQLLDASYTLGGVYQASHNATDSQRASRPILLLGATLTAVMLALLWFQRKHKAEDKATVKA